MSRLNKFLKNELLWAFNINGLETIKALINVINHSHRPAIILISPASIDHIGLDFIVSIVNCAKNLVNKRIFLQLDHANDEKMILDCCSRGFDAIMIDGSDKSLPDNIDFTNNIARKCKQIKKEILIEAEVGKLAHHVIGTNETVIGTNETIKTTLEEFDFFSENVIADMIAVSVGNIHGFKKDKPPLDRKLIKDIYSLTDIPLVLHGGDWISHKDINYLYKHGFRKVNIGPEIRFAVGQRIKEYVNSAYFDTTDHRPLIKEIEEAAYYIIKTKFEAQ